MPKLSNIALYIRPCSNEKNQNLTNLDTFSMTSLGLILLSGLIRNLSLKLKTISRLYSSSSIFILTDFLSFFLSFLLSNAKILQYTEHLPVVFENFFIIVHTTHTYKRVYTRIRLLIHSVLFQTYRCTLFYKSCDIINTFCSYIRKHYQIKYLKIHSSRTSNTRYSFDFLNLHNNLQNINNC